MKHFKCYCDKQVEMQEYQGQICVIVPKFIVLPNKKSGERLSLDACLIPEIFWLWKKGVRTTGCCCGHNKYKPYIGGRY